MDSTLKALNTHVYLQEPLMGDLAQDRTTVFSALRNGTFFIGLDLLHPTRGFEFKADHEQGTSYPGSVIRMGNSVTVKINIPAQAVTRLIHNGQVIQQWNGKSHNPVYCYKSWLLPRRMLSASQRETARLDLFKSNLSLQRQLVSENNVTRFLKAKKIQFQLLESEPSHRSAIETATLFNT